MQFIKVVVMFIMDGETRNKNLHLLEAKRFEQHMRSISELQSTVFSRQCKKNSLKLFKCILL